MSSSVLQYEVMHVMLHYPTPLGMESNGYSLTIQILNVRFLKKKFLKCPESHDEKNAHF